jgi:hypothetical protein
MCREFLVGDQPRQLFDYVVHRLLGNTASLTAQVTVVLHRGTVSDGTCQQSSTRSG